jgi:UDP-N-acetylmuramyl pentapeptide synthase
MALAKNITDKYLPIRILRKIFVWKFLLYLNLWAKIALLIHRPTIIGIAGAVGKSTGKLAISSILAGSAPTRSIDGNSETGIPLGILGISYGNYGILDWIKAVFMAPVHIFSLQGLTYLIVEYGIDGPKAPKNMNYLLSIVTPDIAILLNESPAHVGNYESVLPQKEPLSQEEKLKRIVAFMTADDGLLLTAKTVTCPIVNADDTHIMAFAEKHLIRGRYYTVGVDQGNDVVTLDSYPSIDGTEFSFAIHTHQIKETVHFKINGFLLPKESAAVLGAAMVTGIHVGIPLETIIERLTTTFSLPPGRGTILSGKNESIILDSSYNASSASVLSFVSLLGEMKKETKRPTVFVFGDMKELGEYAPMEHNLVAKTLPGIVDHLILVGPKLQHLVLPYAEKRKAQFKTISWFANSLEAGKYLDSMLPKNALILVKGSQLLEEAIKLILANPKDKKRLCRQDTFWESSKRARNQWVD